MLYTWNLSRWPRRSRIYSCLRRATHTQKNVDNILIGFYVTGLLLCLRYYSVSCWCVESAMRKPLNGASGSSNSLAMPYKSGRGKGWPTATKWNSRDAATASKRLTNESALQQQQHRQHQPNCAWHLKAPQTRIMKNGQQLQQTAEKRIDARNDSSGDRVKFKLKSILPWPLILAVCVCVCAFPHLCCWLARHLFHFYWLILSCDAVPGAVRTPKVSQTESAPPLSANFHFVHVINALIQSVVSFAADHFCVRLLFSCFFSVLHGLWLRRHLFCRSAATRNMLTPLLIGTVLARIFCQRPHSFVFVFRAPSAAMRVLFVRLVQFCFGTRFSAGR